MSAIWPPFSVAGVDVGILGKAPEPAWRPDRTLTLNRRNGNGTPAACACDGTTAARMAAACGAASLISRSGVGAASPLGQIGATETRGSRHCISDDAVLQSGLHVFTDDVLKQIENNVCIDITGIFADGFNGGGGMSYVIACDRSDVFRAVRECSGAVLSRKPIAHFASYGIDDGTCNYSGGHHASDHRGRPIPSVWFPIARSHA